MTVSGATKDSLLKGFGDPWPRPSSPLPPSSSELSSTTPGALVGDGGVLTENNRRVRSDSGTSATTSTATHETTNGRKLGSTSGEGGGGEEEGAIHSSPPSSLSSSPPSPSRLCVPDGVLLKHAVQVWNALCVFPRPMGLRPPPTLDQLMRAIVTLTPSRSSDEAGEVGGVGCSISGAGKEENEDGDGEAEFDDNKASIRAASRSSKRGAKRGEGGGGGGGWDGGGGGEVDEIAKKKAQALLDGVCMSIVRVLSIDLNTVLGR